MTFPFKIPQLGEGLVGARVVTLWKHAGEFVERDEPLLEIETDKAIMSLESPVEGEIEEWLVNVEDDAEVGATVCRIRTTQQNKTEIPHQELPDAAELAPESAPVAAPTPHAIRNGMVSPRGRALARGEGLSADELEQLSQENGRVSVEDFNAHLQQKTRQVAPGEPFTERALSPRQARLATYLERAWREVVPAILEIEISWDGIESEVKRRRAAHGTEEKPLKVTPLHVIAWAICHSMREHPRFCSTWKSGGILREWRHVNIGFAVALEADELAVAVVSRAETMNFETFSQATRREVASIRAGEKSHGEAQFLISDLSRAGIVSAVPLVVPPATAILFVGTPYDTPVRTPTDGVRWEKRARLVLTCDHRLVNGVGAATFLRTLQQALPPSPAA
ncbi:dihydrolipoyllysine-residue acetyltransferase component of pyruvate dehydrogenase complex [Abditibacteriota bacterium]|nr:dihydrolipoyllysine-residue acetyltransferase component of pyruvate dehydrogenase complex [Abditibacteriota bacterium]